MTLIPSAEWPYGYVFGCDNVSPPNSDKLLLYTRRESPVLGIVGIRNAPATHDREPPQRAITTNFPLLRTYSLAYRSCIVKFFGNLSTSQVQKVSATLQKYLLTKPYYDTRDDCQHRIQETIQ